MIRDITIGQYYPTNSVIHRLDPRVKIVCTLAYLISLFIFKSVLGYAICTIFLIAVIRTSKVPFKFITKGLKPIILLLMMTTIFNLFFTSSGKILLSIGFIKITEDGLRASVYMVLRLVYLIIGSSIMTLTTTPNELTDGIERLLRPLNKIKVPVHEIAMMMSIALRFIPILLEETDKIMSAQKARGADLDSGNLMQKVKSLIPILIPLFVSAFRRADELALAMECRCYRGGSGRTRMRQMKLGAVDAVASAVLLLSLGIVIATNFLIPAVI